MRATEVVLELLHAHQGSAERSLVDVHLRRRGFRGERTPRRVLQSLRENGVIVQDLTHIRLAGVSNASGQWPALPAPEPVKSVGFSPRILPDECLTAAAAGENRETNRNETERLRAEVVALRAEVVALRVLVGGTPRTEAPKSREVAPDLTRDRQACSSPRVSREETPERQELREKGEAAIAVMSPDEKAELERALEAEVDHKRSLAAKRGSAPPGPGLVRIFRWELATDASRRATALKNAKTHEAGVGQAGHRGHEVTPMPKLPAAVAPDAGVLEYLRELETLSRTTPEEQAREEAAAAKRAREHEERFSRIKTGSFARRVS